MKQDLANISTNQQIGEAGSLLLGTGLALTAMILVPALAGRLGLADSVTGALRIALMKVSTKAINNR